jgi:hypothetical protein
MQQSTAMLVPELSALVYSNAEEPFDHLVAMAERTLGVHFAPDTGGSFEELNALVTTVLGHTLAIYVGEAEEDDRVEPSGVEVILLPRISFYELSLPAETLSIAVQISDYLAMLLTLQTPYIFQSVTPPVHHPSMHQTQVLWLEATITASVDLLWERWVAPISQALGMAEAQLQRDGASGPEPAPIGAQILGHDVRLEVQPSAPGRPSTLTLRLEPSPMVRALAQTCPPNAVMRVAIDAFLARLVSQHTGLTFTVLR